MSTYFSADGNTAYVTCAVCDTGGDDTMVFWFDEDEGELHGWPQAYKWTLWARIKYAWRHILYGKTWPEGVYVAWHEHTNRDDVKALGEWLVEKSGRIGTLGTEDNGGQS